MWLIARVIWVRQAEAVTVIEDGPLCISVSHAVHKCSRRLHGRAEIDRESDDHCPRVVGGRRGVYLFRWEVKLFGARNCQGGWGEVNVREVWHITVVRQRNA